MSGLSCSVVVPGDNFDGNQGPRNAYGSVGVILDLTHKHSLATFWRKNSGPSALVPMAVWPGSCAGERVRT
jgi:hypothetical protein